MLREATETHLWTSPPPLQSAVIHSVGQACAWQDPWVALTVLLVDDEPASLALATRVLRDIGAEVVATASDAKTAIEAANKMRPDAALVDVGLPDRDGIDLGYDLAALPWRPRVVLMSTDKDAINAIDARHGPDALPFVPKEELASGRLEALLTP
jgi:CheY-like chemotaxis protein